MNIALEDRFDVTNEIVIITGASGQLGIQYSVFLLSKGARVVGIDINASDEVKKLSQQKNKYFFIKADITSKKNLESSLLKIKKKFGPPTVLINNAALDSPPSSSSKDNGPFETYPEDSWDKVLNVNLKGVFLACQIFGNDMAKNKYGSIINISSIYGVVSPDQTLYDYRRKDGNSFFKPVAYSASKSGIINLTKYIAQYWSRSGVRVNTLVISGVFNNQEKEFIDVYSQRIPIGRMAEPSEYNEAILFLSSNASSYMTGSELVIDGGWTAI